MDKDEIAKGRTNYWNSNLAYYSNVVIGNNQYGFTLHVQNAEIAGNYCDGNGQDKVSGCFKVAEPAQKVWVHDNYVSGNRERGFNPKTQSCGFIGKTMQVTNHVYYRNQIINNNLAL